ncbi:MAG: FtsH protease activity modulator HflK [Cardiobacteriaceae bacterium]|nr:FtsH protease activity modulator HflK [Cardiobacteriaceae bacterium]
MFNMLFLCHAAVPRRLLMASQDPWGERPDEPEKPSASGRKDNDQPPDLDELFAKLIGRGRNRGNGGSERPSGNGGGNGGRGRPSMPSLPPMSGKAVVLVAGFVAVGWLASGIYTVQERENGVEIVLGRYNATTGPGLNWNWPYPLGQVEKVDIASISTMRVGEFKTQKGTISTSSQRTGQMLTRDENIVEIGAAVQYRISEPREYLFNVNGSIDLLQDISVSAIREVVGSYDVDEVLRDRRNEWPQQAKQIITETAKEFGIGVEIVALELQDARAPVEVQDAFEDAVRAREDEERLRLEAEAYANEQLPIARGQAEQMMQQAMAYQVGVLAEANASVSRFDNLRAAYEQDKDVMRERLYLETMTDVYAKSRKVMVDADGTRPIINLGNGQAPLVVAEESASASVAPVANGKAAQTPAQNSRNSAPAPADNRLRERSRN